MTNHVARLYALTLSVVVFFAVWLAVSAHPWTQASAPAPASDPRIVLLKARERALLAQTRTVNRIVTRRYAAYHRALAQRRRANARILAQHDRQLAAARQAAATARRVVVTAPTQGSVAAPAPVRVVTLPPVASTRTS